MIISIDDHHIVTLGLLGVNCQITVLRDRCRRHSGGILIGQIQCQCADSLGVPRCQRLIITADQSVDGRVGILLQLSSQIDRLRRCHGRDTLVFTVRRFCRNRHLSGSQHAVGVHILGRAAAGIESGQGAHTEKECRQNNDDARYQHDITEIIG